MTSNASICSVTLIEPILEVINDPTFPAIIMETKVGANSKITDWRVAKPINVFGTMGLSMFRAVWIATTPPTKNDINATMGKELMIRSSISLNIRCRRTEVLV